MLSTCNAVNVPTVVTLLEPVQVLIAVFSTLFNDKSLFTCAVVLLTKPFAVNLAKSPAVDAPSTRNAFVSPIPYSFPDSKSSA